MLRISRRAVQITVILLIIIIPLISNYGLFIEAKGGGKPLDRAREYADTLTYPLYVLLDRTINPPPNADETIELLHKVAKGGIFSISVWGFNITDPLAGILVFLSERKVYAPLLIAITIPLVFILIFGRAFCGWICPLNTLLEVNDWVRKRLGSLGLSIPDIRLDRVYKYLILCLGLFLSLLGLSIIAYILPYGLVSREVYHYIYENSFSFGVIIIVAIILFELILSRRGWCRYLCPAGAFFSILGAGRMVRVERKGECISDCVICEEECKIGLSPREKRFGMECDNCGQCVSLCPPGVLGYKVGLKRRRFKSKCKR